MKHQNTPVPFAQETTFPPFHTHQTYITISKSAINHNIGFFKNKIGTHNNLALVIKGNGYGHGLQEMGSIAQQNSLVDWLCVATLSEALTLHNTGIQKPILILGYADIDLIHGLHKNFAFMVDTLDYAHKLNTIGKQYNYRFAVHIKIDTGLSRLGVMPHTALPFMNALQKLDYLCITGVFSHFIASDNNPELTNKQLSLFLQTINSIVCKNNLLIHMSNTMAITSLPYPNHFNFFRVGLGMYGFGADQLIPALSWKTHIVSIKTVPAHSYVSYACTYKTNRTTRIAIIPIGYAHGYQLRFSNKAHVLINGILAPIIGRVGMNMTMIDITECPASIDDEVTLIGTTPGIRASDKAHAGDIYNIRELLTGLHPDIPRIITP